MYTVCGHIKLFLVKLQLHLKVECVVFRGLYLQNRAGIQFNNVMYNYVFTCSYVFRIEAERQIKGKQAVL